MISIKHAYLLCIIVFVLIDSPIQSMRGSIKGESTKGISKEDFDRIISMIDKECARPHNFLNEKKRKKRKELQEIANDAKKAQPINTDLGPRYHHPFSCFIAGRLTNKGELCPYSPSSLHSLHLIKSTVQKHIDTYHLGATTKRMTKKTDVRVKKQKTNPQGVSPAQSPDVTSPALESIIKTINTLQERTARLEKHLTSITKTTPDTGIPPAYALYQTETSREPLSLLSQTPSSEVKDDCKHEVKELLPIAEGFDDDLF